MKKSKPQTPKERDCLDSVGDSLKSIGGAFWPGNWNSADMQRLYEMGPLGQAEALTNPNGDFFDRNAYNLTAGSLAVSGVAVTGAAGLGALEIRAAGGVGIWAFEQTGGSAMLTRNPYLRIGWSKGPGGNQWFRIASNIGNRMTKIDLLKGPKIGVKPTSCIK